MASPRPLRGDLLLPGAALELPPPDYLSAQAREFLSDMVRCLAPSGLLSEMDTTSLSMLCENLADYWGIRREIENIESTPSPDSDEQKKVLGLRLSAAKVLSDLDSRIRAWLGEMLMTPASRARAGAVQAAIPEPELDLSELDAEERAQLRNMLKRRQQLTDGRSNGSGRTIQ